MKRALLAAALALSATMATPQDQPDAPTATLTLDEARGVARRALYAGEFELARQLAMGLLDADETDPFAYGVLAAAHSRMNDPRLARAAARLSYKYAKSPPQKFGAARTAASIAFQQERPTRSQAWLRLAATHADTEQQEKLLSRDYARVRAANPLRFNISASLAPSDNVNNGTDNVLEVINGVPTLGFYRGGSRALSGTVGTFDIQARYRLNQTATSHTQAHARLYTRRVALSSSARAIAPGLRNSDFASTYAEVGLRHQFALGAQGNYLSLGGAVGASWSGGEASYDFAKMNVARGMRIAPATQLTLNAGVERRMSTQSNIRDTDVVTLGAQIGHKLQRGDRINLGVTMQTVSGAFINADYLTASLRASYAFGKKLGPAHITTGLTVGYTDYDTYLLVNPVAGGRQDMSVYGDVSLFFADYDFAGFAPTVQLRSGQRSSNVNRFDISETTISLGIQSKF